MQKVEKASDQATDIVLGGYAPPQTQTRSSIRKNTQKDVDRAKLHNAAYIEGTLSFWKKIIRN